MSKQLNETERLIGHFQVDWPGLHEDNPASIILDEPDLSDNAIRCVLDQYPVDGVPEPEQEACKTFLEALLKCDGEERIRYEEEAPR